MTVRTMTITTIMMTTRMTACNVCTHTHTASLLQMALGARKDEQASITMTAPHALTNTYEGGSIIGHTLSSDEQRAPVAGSFSFGGHGGPVTCMVT